MARFQFDLDSDTWLASEDGAEYRVPAAAFAARLDSLANSRYGRCWVDLGEDEYIDILGEVESDLAFWRPRPHQTRAMASARPRHARYKAFGSYAPAGAER